MARLNLKHMKHKGFNFTFFFTGMRSQFQLSQNILQIQPSEDGLVRQKHVALVWHSVIVKMWVVVLTFI